MATKLNLCTRIKAFNQADADGCIAGLEGHAGDHVFGKRVCEVRWRLGDAPHWETCRLPYMHRSPHRPEVPGEELCPTCQGMGGSFSGIVSAQTGRSFTRCATCGGWGVVGVEAS